MNKKNILWIVLGLIFLVVFNTVFFVLGGTQHALSVWLSYAFIHLAYILLLITPLLVRSGSQKAMFGMTLSSISSGYFLLEFVVGLIFIIIKSESYKAALVTQIIIAGIYAIVLVANMIANESTADSVAEHEYELIYVKTCSQKLKSIMESVTDKALRKKIEKAYDAVHGSQVKSDSRVAPLEQQVDSLIDELKSAISSGNNDSAADKAERITSVADERNRQLKSMN